MSGKTDATFGSSPRSRPEAALGALLIRHPSSASVSANSIHAVTRMRRRFVSYGPWLAARGASRTFLPAASTTLIMALGSATLSNRRCVCCSLLGAPQSAQRRRTGGALRYARFCHYANLSYMTSWCIASSHSANIKLFESRFAPLDASGEAALGAAKSFRSASQGFPETPCSVRIFASYDGTVLKYEHRLFATQPRRG
jgi:hypothetical protein